MSSFTVNEYPTLSQLTNTTKGLYNHGHDRTQVMELDIPLPDLFGLEGLDYGTAAFDVGFSALSGDETIGSPTAAFAEISDLFAFPDAQVNDIKSSSTVSLPIARKIGYASVQQTRNSSPTLSSISSLNGSFVDSVGSPVYSNSAPTTKTSASSQVADSVPGAKKASVKRERNRLAAERCRARKLQLISSLQIECDALKAERESLVRENLLLRELLSKLPK